LRSLRVGWDCDGVLYPFRKNLSEYLISQGYEHCTEDNASPEWNFYNGWNMTHDEYMKMFTQAVDRGIIFRVGEPYPGAVQALEAVVELGHTNHIVTDRSVGTEPYTSLWHTAEWLAEWKFPLTSLTISRDKTVVPVDIYIDDRLENYDALDAIGVEVYLLNQDWNQVGNDVRRRVDSLEEYLQQVQIKAMEELWHI